MCAGCLTIGSAPIDFGQLESTVKNQSSFLYTLSSTGTVTQPYSTLTLTGSGSAFEVFTLSSAQLNGNSGIAVTGVAANATILINVTDSGSHSATTSNGGFSINGQQLQNTQNVVFNFALIDYDDLDRQQLLQQHAGAIRQCDWVVWCFQWRSGRLKLFRQQPIQSGSVHRKHSNAPRSHTGARYSWPICDRRPISERRCVSKELHRSKTN